MPHSTISPPNSRCSSPRTTNREARCPLFAELLAAPRGRPAVRGRSSWSTTAAANGTAERILRRVARRPLRRSPVLLSENACQSAALASWCGRALAGLIVTLDADLQNDPAGPSEGARRASRYVGLRLGVRPHRHDTLGGAPRPASARERHPSAGSCDPITYIAARSRPTGSRRWGGCGWTCVFFGVHRFLPALFGVAARGLKRCPSSSPAPARGSRSTGGAATVLVARDQRSRPAFSG